MSHKNVLRHTRVACSGVAAQRALERLLSRVLALVDDQVALLREAPATLLTLVRLVTAVHAHVPVEAVVARQQQSAIGTLDA
jgi:hypothetical protein